MSSICSIRYTVKKKIDLRSRMSVSTTTGGETEKKTYNVFTDKDGSLIEEGPPHTTRVRTIYGKYETEGRVGKQSVSWGVKNVAEREKDD